MARFTSSGASARLALAAWLFAARAFSQGVWERLADYPVETFEVSTAALGGKVYAVCGLTASGAVNRMFVYDPGSDQWTEKASAPLPQGGDHCNVAAVNGKLYLLGALVRAAGPALADGGTYEYDPESDAWSRVAQMPAPRAASGVAVIGSTIYVIGGISGSTSYAATEAFNTETRQWTRLPDMPTARDHLTAQAVDGRIYAIGGRPGRGLSTNANEELDPAIPAWRAREPSPFRAEGMGSGVMGNRIVLAGVGEGFRETVDYDPATGEWRTHAPMGAPRNGWYGSGAVIDGQLYLPAGGPEPGNSYSRIFDMFVYPPATPPRVLSVRHAATIQSEVGAGAIVSIFGEHLTRGHRRDSRGAGQLNGTSVRVGGQAAQLLFANEKQLNLVLPPDLLPGAAEVAVSLAGQSSAAVPLLIQPSAPGIFALDGSGSGRALAFIAGTPQLAQPPPMGRPARAGEVLELYGTGLASDGFVLDLGGTLVASVEVEEMPGHAGLQRIRFAIPPSVMAADAAALQCVSNGVRSNTVTIATAR